MLVGELTDELILKAFQAGLLDPEDPNVLKQEIPAEALPVLAQKYPEVVTTQQVMGPGGEMTEQYGRTITQEQVDKPTNKTPEQLADPYIQDEPGGIFIYNLSGTDDRGNTTSTRFNRKERLSDAEKQIVREGVEANMGKVSQFAEDVVDEPAKVLTYLIDKGYIKGNITDELLRTYAAQPSLFRGVALGQDPMSLKSILAGMGDILSTAGRETRASLFTEYPKDATEEQKARMRQLETARLTPSGDAAPLLPTSVSKYIPSGVRNFGATMAQAALQDPFLIPSIGVSGGLASLARTAPIKAVGGEIALGATTGAGTAALDEARNLRTLSGGDYMWETGLSGGLSGLLPGISNRKGIATSWALRPPGKIGEQARKFQKGLAAGDPQKLQKLRQKELFQGIRPSEEWDLDQVKFLADDLNLDMEAMFPGLGLRNRSGDMGALVTKLANENPRFYAQWENAYEALTDSLHKKTGFKTALDPQQAGDTLKESMKQAKDQMFKENETTYRFIAENPELAVGVDIELHSNLPKLTGELSGLKKDLMKGRGEYLEEVIDPETGEILEYVTRPVKGVVKEQDDAIASALTTIVAIEKIAKSAGKTPEWAAGTGKLLQQVNQQRANLARALSELPVFEIPSERLKTMHNVEKTLKGNIRNAVSKYDTDLAAALDRSAKGMADYFKDESKVARFLDSDKLDGTGVFRSITRNADNMDAIRNILSTYKQEEAFEKMRDSWFKDTVLKFASSGEVSDKQRFSKNINAIANYYNPNVAKNLEKLGKAFYNLGSPLRQGLGAAMKTGMGSSGDLWSATSSPKGFAKMIRDNVQGFGTFGSDMASAETKALADKVYSIQRLGLGDALDGRQRPPGSAAEALGRELAPLRDLIKGGAIRQPALQADRPEQEREKKKWNWRSNR
jgi:hypothetical protein